MIVTLYYLYHALLIATAAGVWTTIIRALASAQP